MLSPPAFSSSPRRFSLTILTVGVALAFKEVHGVLVELGLVDLILSFVNLNLDWNLLTKRSSLSSNELEDNLVGSESDLG